MGALYDLADHYVRAEYVIWIPAAVADMEALPDVFKERFLEDMPENADAALYQSLPALKQFAEGDEYPDPWEVADVLHRVDGFLVQAATPVRHYSDGGQRAQFSWGHYRTEWLYAADVEDMQRVMIEFAQRVDAECRAKAA